jgi:hypothetical protein
LDSVVVDAAAAGGHGHWGVAQAGRGDVLGMDGGDGWLSLLAVVHTTPFHFKSHLPFFSYKKNQLLPPPPQIINLFTIN